MTSLMTSDCLRHQVLTLLFTYILSDGLPDDL